MQGVHHFPTQRSCSILFMQIRLAPKLQQLVIECSRAFPAACSKGRLAELLPRSWVKTVITASSFQGGSQKPGDFRNSSEIHLVWPHSLG
eukprot:s204_g16.t1